MDDRTEPICTGTNWYGGTRFWYDIIWFGPWYEVIWFDPWFVILVWNYGPKLSGTVHGPKFWYETQWFGWKKMIIIYGVDYSIFYKISKFTLVIIF